MADNIYPTHWIRAVLPLAVLRVLADGESYGYDISARLAQAGFGDIKGGTLYPLLGRLEKDGLVTTRWTPGESGPGRKYYTLSPAGRDHLTAHIADWTRFSQTVGVHFADSKGDSHDQA